VETVYIAGTADGVVTVSDGQPDYGAGGVELAFSADHFSTIAPGSREDMSYRLLRRAVLE
jgi:hypothetical protein